MIVRSLVYTAVVWVSVAGYLYFRQGKFLFPAPAEYRKAWPGDIGLPCEDLRIPVATGDHIHAWWIPFADPQSKTAIVFHGNGYVIEDMVAGELASLRSLGLNLLLVDYRGYGGSSGITPDESTILGDSAAAYACVIRKQISADRILVIGRSIGSGPAVYLAANHPGISGLILESPFSSIDDAARESGYLRIFPIGLMLKTHFNNAARISSVKVPIFIAVGSDDDLTPPWMARKLYERSRARKTLLVIDRAGHNDLVEVGGPRLRDALLAYLSGSVNG